MFIGFPRKPGSLLAGGMARWGLENIIVDRQRDKHDVY
jgi:hypothetical protein